MAFDWNEYLVIAKKLKTEAENDTSNLSLAEAKQRILIKWLRKIADELENAPDSVSQTFYKARLMK